MAANFRGAGHWCNLKLVGSNQEINEQLVIILLKQNRRNHTKELSATVCTKDISEWLHGSASDLNWQMSTTDKDLLAIS
jgi:hypothetical protein